MKYLCENIQGVIIGYTQSDEITLILQDYKRFETSAWFDYEVQKVCSISASMATMAFNQAFIKRQEGIHLYNEVYSRKIGKAQFDSRCFNIPKEEVTNLLLWRQLDACRNSVQMVGRAYFSHKQLEGKTTAQVLDMLAKIDVNWHELPIYMQRGSCCIRDNKGHWFVDNEIPIFKEDGREYIERLVNCEVSG